MELFCRNMSLNILALNDLPVFESTSAMSESLP